MISLTSIITAIRGASLATKIGLGVGAVAVVASGTAGTVAIINNANRTPETQQITSELQNDDNSSSGQNNTQVGETGEPEDDEEKDDQPTNEDKPSNTISANNNSQTTTQKPSSNASNQSNSNNSSTSKPSTPTPTQPSQPSQPTQPSQPSQPAQPSQPSRPTKKPDYNLNENYVIAYCFAAIGGSTSNFYAVNKNSETATNSCVAKMISSARNHSEYSNMSDDDIFAEIGGGGYSGQLTEAECSKNGLSCGRW